MARKQKYSKKELKKLLFEFIEYKQAATFAELENRFGDEAKGSVSWCFGKANVCLWFNMSEKFYSALDDLFKVGKIYFSPTTKRAYRLDGIVPKAPIAKSYRKYEKKHWYPVVVKPVDFHELDLSSLKKVQRKKSKKQAKTKT